MNKRLQKKIKAYAGFASVLLAADKTNGQVVYVDINPDTLVSAIPPVCQSYFLIDVDNDGTADFNFIARSGPYSYYGPFFNSFVAVDPASNNKINNALYHSGYTSTNNNFAMNAMKLNYGDTININGSWLNVQKYLFEFDIASFSGGNHYSEGAWNPFSDGYLPFLFFKNSNNYYGWMHIQLLTPHSFLLKEYAYSTVPNIALRAGYTTLLKVNQEYNSQFNFSQQSNSIHISTFQKLNHANIFVYDLLGKEILQQSFEGKEATITIDKKGIYFAEVDSEKGIFRKKIFIY